MLSQNPLHPWVSAFPVRWCPGGRPKEVHIQADPQQDWQLSVGQREVSGELGEHGEEGGTCIWPGRGLGQRVLGAA